MSVLTQEKLVTMNREELLAVPFATYDKMMRRGPEFSEELNRHLNAELEPVVVPHVKAFEDAWEQVRNVDLEHLNVPDLADALAKEHGLVITRVWARLTENGVANLEKAKWVHRQLAWVVLQVFYPGQNVRQMVAAKKAEG